MPTTRSKRKRTDEGGQEEDAAVISPFKDQLKRFKYSAADSSASAATAFSSPSQPPGPRKGTPKKRAPKPTGYAPPSTYAHLPPLTDIFTPNLIAIFIGTNPGIRTSTSGHAYAHPTNLFWRLLHSSGVTDTLHPPSDDIHLPRIYALGNTNIVSRPTRDASQLSKEEMRAGAGILEDKMATWRPEAVCVVGKGIWDAIYAWRHGKAQSRTEFRYGWQADSERMGRSSTGGEGWEGARVFVATSTSGLAAGMKPPEKLEVWKPFGKWVRQRREERQREGVVNTAWQGVSRVEAEEKGLEAEEKGLVKVKSIPLVGRCSM